jgi:hypothetical protein
MGMKQAAKTQKKLVKLHKKSELLKDKHLAISAKIEKHENKLSAHLGRPLSDEDLKPGAELTPVHSAKKAAKKVA